jgi:hypothetical protein
MRKALLKYAMILMATLSLASLYACGNDDDNDSGNSSNDLVGVWVDNEELEDGDPEPCAYQFNSDGTGIDGCWILSKKRFTDDDSDLITWSVTSDKLVINTPEYDEVSIYTYMVSGNTLYLWAGDNNSRHYVYTKVK